MILSSDSDEKRWYCWNHYKSSALLFLLKENRWITLLSDQICNVVYKRSVTFFEIVVWITGIWTACQDCLVSRRYSGTAWLRNAPGRCNAICPAISWAHSIAWSDLHALTYCRQSRSGRILTACFLFWTFWSLALAMFRTVWSSDQDPHRPRASWRK